MFLSASVPSHERAEKYRRISQAFARIEEAALRVAASVFNAGGRVVFGGHPSISPLIGYLCEQYQLPVEAEAQRPVSKKSEYREIGPHVVMYQSELYRESWAAPSERLSRLPGVEVIWTPAVTGESLNPNLQGEIKSQESLRAMREQMIKDPQIVGMVVIGGMEGVEQEFRSFRQLRNNLPIYSLPSTGGAAQILTERNPDLVRSFDDEVRANVLEFRRRKGREQESRVVNQSDSDKEEILIPYANVASRIIQDIIHRLESQ